MVVFSSGAEFQQAVSDFFSTLAITLPPEPSLNCTNFGHCCCLLAYRVVNFTSVINPYVSPLCT